MSEKDTEQKFQTLGEFLKKSRKAANLSLEDAQDSTKITLAVLKAIEKDDFSSMPAEAFCRGFYVMYAKFLNLDHEEVLSRYLEARGLPPVASNIQSTPPVRKSGQFSNYAEPSSISPLMSSIFALAILLIVIIGGCWYFSWNPVDYINNKLDAMGDKGQQESVLAEDPAPALNSEPAIEKEAEPAREQELSQPLTSNIAEDNTPLQEEAVLGEETAPAPYHLEILFQTNGILTVTLDNGFFIDKEFKNGQTLQWDVQQSILLDMPETVDARIQMNGIEIPLPETKNGQRILSLPEDLLN